MRTLLSLALVVALGGSCCSRRCSADALSLEVVPRRPLCVDEFATEIHDNCFVRLI